MEPLPRGTDHRPADRAGSCAAHAPGPPGCASQERAHRRLFPAGRAGQLRSDAARQQVDRGPRRKRDDTATRQGDARSLHDGQTICQSIRRRLIYLGVSASEVDCIVAAQGARVPQPSECGLRIPAAGHDSAEMLHQARSGDQCGSGSSAACGAMRKSMTATGRGCGSARGCRLEPRRFRGGAREG